MSSGILVLERNKKNMKNKKDLIYIIVIVLFALIIVGESIYIFKDKDIKPNCKESQTVTIYKGHEFLLENIDNQLPDFIKLDNNVIINDGHTLLLTISTIKDIINSKITIEYYDENNNLVDKTEQNIGVLLKNNEFIVESNIPELNDKYSGKIKLTMETTDFEEANYEGFDRTALKLETSSNSNPTTNELNISIQGTNPYNQKITELSGYVLLYEKDKIINRAYFTNEGEIAAGAEIKFNIKAYPIYGNEITYDRLEVVINYLY